MGRPAQPELITGKGERLTLIVLSVSTGVEWEVTTIVTSLYTASTLQQVNISTWSTDVF